MAAINAEFIGSGYLALKDTSNNVYPVGVLQDCSLNMSSEVKELMGANKMPILTAEVGRKIKITAKFAQFSSALVNILGAGTTTTGSRYVSTKAKTAAVSTFTVATADDGTPAGWAFVADLGLVYASNGQPLKFNSGSLAATGEYKNTAGVYTVGTGEATTNYLVSYVWSQTAGERTTFSNSAIGLSTYFAVYMTQATTQADGTLRKVMYEFPAVLLPTLKMDFKNTDFATSDLELNVFQDSSGYYMYQSVL
jgi:hypothetical protein